MNKNYDQEFGPGGAYAWPSDLDVAKALIRAAPTEKSSADCLNDYFFDDFLRSYEDEDEDLDLAKATAKSRQELFKDAKNWPLPYLVASAAYEIVSKNTDMSLTVWRDFFWLFLFV